MKLIRGPAVLRLSLALLAVTLGSGCRGMRIRQLEQRSTQLEVRIAQLEDRMSSIEERLEPRVIPVPGRIQPQGK